MKYDFIIRIYKDKTRNPTLSDLQDITISDITLVSKKTKCDEICLHKANQKKFKYNIELSKPFNKISGSHSYPNLSFKGEYLDVIVKNFPRYPSFYQNKYAAKSCLEGFGYTNYLNGGFPHQLLYRKIVIIFDIKTLKPSEDLRTDNTETTHQMAEPNNPRNQS